MCVQINVDVFGRKEDNSGMFSLAKLPREAATNRKV